MQIYTFIGNKDFLMGACATEADCSIFGLLAQIKWNSSGSPYAKMLESKYKEIKLWKKLILRIN